MNSTNALKVARQTIKATRWNAETRQYEEVTPWDAYANGWSSEGFVFFFAGSQLGEWYTCPDEDPAIAAADWRAQWGW